MESSAKLAGHAIHQQLIVLPLGLLATAVVFDLLRLVTDNDDFAVASYLMIAGGVLSGLLAAVFGLVDYLAVPAGTRARRVGAVHGVGNVVVVGLFGRLGVGVDSDADLDAPASFTTGIRLRPSGAADRG